MKTSEIYEACIPLLEQKQFKFICHAIEHVHGGSWEGVNEASPTAVDLHDRIGTETLDSFVYILRGGDFSDTCEVEYPDREEMLPLRVALCKSLAQEFKAKGD